MFKNAFANFPWKELATRLISDTPFLIPCDGSQCLWLIFYFQVKQYPDVPNLLCWNIYPCQQDSEIYTPATKISSPLYYSIYAVYMQYIYIMLVIWCLLLYIYLIYSLYLSITRMPAKTYSFRHWLQQGAVSVTFSARPRMWLLLTGCLL